MVDGRALVVPGHEEGFFVGPTLLRHVQPTMRAYCDEVFGPLLVVMEVDTLAEAIELVNSSPYGNGTAIFTASGEAARIYTEEIQVGMVGVNVPIPVPVGYYSFGGWKDSLFGDHHAHGPEGSASTPAPRPSRPAGPTRSSAPRARASTSRATPDRTRIPEEGTARSAPPAPEEQRDEVAVRLEGARTLRDSDGVAHRSSGIRTRCLRGRTPSVDRTGTSAAPLR